MDLMVGKNREKKAATENIGASDGHTGQERTCLQCDQPFASRDQKKNRICPGCAANQESEDLIYGGAL